MSRSQLSLVFQYCSLEVLVTVEQRLLAEVWGAIRQLDPDQAERLAASFRLAEREMEFEESRSVAFLEAVARHHSALLRRAAEETRFDHAVRW